MYFVLLFVVFTLVLSVWGLCTVYRTRCGPGLGARLCLLV